MASVRNFLPLTGGKKRGSDIGVKFMLRKSVRKKLAGLSPAVAHAKSMAASKRLLALPEFDRARVVMIYLPLPGELDVTPIALRGWQEQKVIAAPKTSWDDRHIIPLEIRSLETGLVTGNYGLREPADGEPIPPDLLDLVIVPGLAFDRKGNRLGRGAGFYDRFLASPHLRAVTVGMAWREQVVEKVPVKKNDIPVHMLVTDEEALRFSPAPAADEGKEAGR